MPSSISSQDLWPTSLMNIRPVPGWNAKVNGFRRPRAQIGPIDAGRPVVERVVGGDRAIGIDPEDLAEQGCPASGAWRRRWCSSHADIELAVRSEVDGPPLWLVAELRRIQVEQDNLTPGLGDVAVGHEPADAVASRRAGHGVIDINIMIDLEIWVECHAQQAARPAESTFSETKGIARSCPPRMTRRRTALLADEDPAIGSLRPSPSARTGR